MTSLCIVGVDGTGKSTVIDELRKLFSDEKAVIQYMGTKNWELPHMQYLYSNESRYVSIRRRLYLIPEMYHRIYKYKDETRLIIFDRYLDEQILQFSKYSTLDFKQRVIKWLYSFFFRYLFYKPTITVYLYCDLKTSIARKDDIVTNEHVEKLTANKKIMDEYYLNQINVSSINTGNLDVQEVVGRILVEMRKKGFNIF